MTISMYISLSLHIYIYIYIYMHIWRERERERDYYCYCSGAWLPGPASHRVDARLDVRLHAGSLLIAIIVNGYYC